jgi:DNA-binding protein H-NS
MARAVRSSLRTSEPSVALRTEVFFRDLPSRYRLKDNRLIRNDSLSGTELKTTFTFTAVLSAESISFSGSTFYALLGAISPPSAPLRIREWNGREFITATHPSQSSVLLEFSEHRTVLVLNEDWTTFADLRFRNGGSCFLKAVIPIINGRPVVARASVSLSGSEFENEMKLKMISLSQKTVVKKCDLESEFTEIEEMPMPCERIRRELEESRAEGVQLTTTLEQLSQKLEQLREEVAKEKEKDSEPFEGTLSKLKEEQEMLKAAVKSGIVLTTAMRDTLVGQRRIQEEFRKLAEAGRTFTGEFRDAKLAWNASVQEYGDGLS